MMSTCYKIEHPSSKAMIIATRNVSRSWLTNRRCSFVVGPAGWNHNLNTCSLITKFEQHHRCKMKPNKPSLTAKGLRVNSKTKSP
eukprot:6476826-Amphidinium_carterae.1